MQVTEVLDILGAKDVDAIRLKLDKKIIADLEQKARLLEKQRQKQEEDNASP